jgi:hypothetical protein
MQKQTLAPKLLKMIKFYENQRGLINWYVIIFDDFEFGRKNIVP